MAERADQQRGAPASLWIRRAADVPPEPAVRPVAEQFGQDGAAASRTDLDPADSLGAPARMRGRADGEFVAAVSVQVADGDGHATVRLARLTPRPAPQLLAGAAGID